LDRKEKEKDKEKEQKKIMHCVLLFAVQYITIWHAINHHQLYTSGSGRPVGCMQLMTAQLLFMSQVKHFVMLQPAPAARSACALCTRLHSSSSLYILTFSLRPEMVLAMSDQRFPRDMWDCTWGQG
jgi:hypothetical protein